MNMHKKYYSPKFFTDIEGKRFGKWTAEKFVEFRVTTKSGKRQAFWKVKCDCGNSSEIARGRLMSGNSTNCGCNTEALTRLSNKKTVGDLTGSVWHRITSNAKARKHKVIITQAEAEALYHKQNKMCALSKLPIELPQTRKDKGTASLDRIDSNGDYEVGNVQWVHKDVNKMKNTFSQNYFLNLCCRIAGAALDKL